MERLLSLTILCLFLTASLAEAQLRRPMQRPQSQQREPAATQPRPATQPPGGSTDSVKDVAKYRPVIVQEELSEEEQKQQFDWATKQIDEWKTYLDNWAKLLKPVGIKAIGLLRRVTDLKPHVAKLQPEDYASQKYSDVALQMWKLEQDIGTFIIDDSILNVPKWKIVNYDYDLASGTFNVNSMDALAVATAVTEDVAAAKKAVAIERAVALESTLQREIAMVAQSQLRSQRAGSVQSIAGRMAGEYVQRAATAAQNRVKEMAEIAEMKAELEILQKGLEKLKTKEKEGTEEHETTPILPPEP